uniref:TNF superfamily member 12 n=1 Tax=Podarcis muralis TaxID=64176 RepID=A0A670J0P5_PODMU
GSTARSRARTGTLGEPDWVLAASGEPEQRTETPFNLPPERRTPLGNRTRGSEANGGDLERCFSSHKLLNRFLLPPPCPIDADGTIRGWVEAKLNTTSPLRYDSSRGEFRVAKRGLYYLYCQVHFNEGKTIYMKLDIMLDGELALRCLEQFPPTSSGPQDPELRVCQVSGLVLLRPDESIRVRTIANVQKGKRNWVVCMGSLDGCSISFWELYFSLLHFCLCRDLYGFATEIWWEPFLQQGRALELSGRDVVVRHMGLYFVYSQVLFRDPTFTMGQVLWRKAHGKPGQILFRCVQSMPPNPEKAFNSCYSGGVFHLQPGDRLNLRIPRFNASFDLTAHGTFLGFLRL